MKNANYNLIKLLHNALDDAWRVEKHYQKDAKASGCHSCAKLLSALGRQFAANVAMIEKELKAHLGKKGRL